MHRSPTRDDRRAPLCALLALVAACTAGCMRDGYVHGEVARERGVDPESYREIGCLDLAFGAVRDRVAFDAPPESLILEVHAGNRCAHPTPFDLTAVTLELREGGVRRGPVTLHDPRNEIEPRTLDAFAFAHERVQLDLPGGAAVTAPDARLCLDVRRVSPEFRAATPAPFCISLPGPAPSFHDESTP